MNRVIVLAVCAILATSSLLVSCVEQETEVVETYYDTEYRTEYKTEQYAETETVVISSKEGREFLDPVAKWQTGLYFWDSGAPLTHYFGYQIDPNRHPNARVRIEINRPQLRLPGFIVAIDLTGPGQVPPKPEVTRGFEPLPDYRERAWLDGVAWVLAEEKRFLGGVRTMENCAEYNPGDVGWRLGLKIPGEQITISIFSNIKLPWAGRVACGGDSIEFDASGIWEFAVFANAWHTFPVDSVKLVWRDDVVTQKPVTKERQVAYQVPYQVEKQRVVKQVKKVPFWEAIFGK